MVARLVRDQKVVGSSPVTSTTEKGVAELLLFFVPKMVYSKRKFMLSRRAGEYARAPICFYLARDRIARDHHVKSSIRKVGNIVKFNL